MRRPKTLNEGFEAFVLGAPWRHWVPQSRGEKRYTRDVGLLAKAVGACLVRQGIDIRPFIARAVAIQEQNSSLSFGEGLARDHADPDRLWREARDIYLQAEPTSRDKSEEHTSELQSLMRISYAVFCLNKKK